MVAGASFNDEGVPSAVTEYHVMKYKIPEDLACTHCTLQWYWSTGNSCLYDADYLGTDGYFQRNAAAFQALGWNPADWCPWCVTSWATCDNSCCKSGGTFGEEFWNCADIAVIGSGSDIQDPIAGVLTPGSPSVPMAPEPEPESEPESDGESENQPKLKDELVKAPETAPKPSRELEPGAEPAQNPVGAADASSESVPEPEPESETESETES